ncbi:hypothetical protein [uncultured Muribaculum sp.]|jgi:H+/Cl- antiporter ClcA|uniref:hypothetical protein n=1 Tax=uncultured Muribaculum sp. TaxID=1918613 RepID=UPI00272F7AE3|nr:hypothetical protein [uncultured Muribaculum sp.]
MSPEKIFFLLPKKGKFLDSFHNDNLKNQAELVWRSLDGWTPWLLLIMAVLGIGLAAYYYKPYNDMPGRHYKVSHWAIWGIISVALTFIATLCIEYFGIKTNLRTGLNNIYILIALNNAIYCAILYFVTSVVWCFIGPTNAYRLFKP